MRAERGESSFHAEGTRGSEQLLHSLLYFNSFTHWSTYNPSLYALIQPSMRPFIQSPINAPSHPFLYAPINHYVFIHPSMDPAIHPSSMHSFTHLPIKSIHPPNPLMNQFIYSPSIHSSLHQFIIHSSIPLTNPHTSTVFLLVHYTPIHHHSSTHHSLIQPPIYPCVHSSVCIYLFTLLSSLNTFVSPSPPIHMVNHQSTSVYPYIHPPFLSSVHPPTYPSSRSLIYHFVLL